MFNNILVNLWVLGNVRNFLPKWKTVILSIMISFHRVGFLLISECRILKKEQSVTQCLVK
jgi:hypothetical protein